MDLTLYSKCRNEIMGLSILWILIFHMHVVNHPFLENGFLGVDIFVFLSGLSMFNSFRKNKSSVVFFKKRLIRILPCYYAIQIPFMIYCFIIGSHSFIEATRSLLLLNPFFNVFELWFVPFILICYLFVPYLYSLIKNKKYVLLFLIIIICSGVDIFYNIQLVKFFVRRFPLFIIGMVVGKYLTKEYYCSLSHNTMLDLLWVLGGMTCCYFLSCRVGYFEKFFFLKQIFSLVFAYSFAVIINYGRILRFLFSKIGAITLELYLVQESISIPLSKLINTLPLQIFFCLILTFSLASFLRLLVKWMENTIVKEIIC